MPIELTITGLVVAVVRSDKGGLVLLACSARDKGGAASSVEVGLDSAASVPACVGNDIDNVGLVLAVCIDEADGLALGTLLALREGEAVGTRLGPGVRNAEGFSDGFELEGDTERSAGLADGLKLGPKVGEGDGALVIG